MFSMVEIFTDKHFSIEYFKVKLISNIVIKSSDYTLVGYISVIKGQ